MEKIFKLVMLCLSLLAAPSFADTLILSHKLKLEYQTPSLISHGPTDLIVKYDDNRHFMHVVVDPKNIYQRIDLTGKERLYIKSIFDKEMRVQLSKELAELSKEQAYQFGVTADNVQRLEVGNSEIIAVYNDKDGMGQIFIFEKLSIHQFYTKGTEKEHNQILNGIKER